MSGNPNITRGVNGSSHCERCLRVLAYPNKGFCSAACEGSRVESPGLRDLRRRAAAFKPHPGWPHRATAPSTSWRDSSRDLWGGRKGSSDRAFWVDGNCLRAAVATQLNIDVKQ